MEWIKALVSGTINFCRGLIRPVITVGLVVVVCVIIIMLFKLVASAFIAGQLTAEQLMVLVASVFGFFTTITATAVGYWFAERKSSGGSSTPTS